MKPSLKLTNAIHILIYIARADKQTSFSSKAIAESVNTNPSRIRALMADMQAASIIKREGDHFSRPILAKPAKDISMAAILKAVDPDSSVFPLDNKVNDDCPIAQQVNPVLSSYYEELDQNLLKKMAGISFEAILEDVNQKAGARLCCTGEVQNA
ncbi:Rrf2 family transcriptional regulator [Fructobacillus parabroussonetiae]|uniref:Rrf2 family transcriptional regulator n=1 Tax=Fructobacillus parabroussonetiae TaxID=2713174 RepID=A0ABS5QUL4_9LACO|nr:Rrf2 family transcriptional regulator [Fructobacillus parabroussonetiae]MBS9336880.1 Rrf2 family transcriptional regulator [Fructobacillus parabroussonetiae]MCK8617512.1 Rrf2 family transcriptional regulator [Fructobacillus parabroussonetiae]